MTTPSADLETRDDRTPVEKMSTALRSPAFRDQVALALPSAVNADRFARIAITALQENPSLAELEPTSVIRALLRCAQDGLLPDGREAAIVARKDKASYMSMIGGLRKIAAENGWQLRTKAVYEGDTFEYTDEPPTITHVSVSRSDGDRGVLVAAYAVATHRDGRRMQTILWPADIAKRRGKATTQKVWEEWPAQMWEKSAGRDLFGELPIEDRERVARLLAAEETGEGSGPPASDPELEPGSAPAGEATAAQPAPGGPETAFTGEEPGDAPEEPGDAPEETADGPGAFVLPDAFKKHAGRTLADVAADDETYLEWLASDAITLDDVRGAAQAFLAGRQS